MLGANGKLGRMLRFQWSNGGPDIVPVVRRPLPTGESVWTPGADVSGLPQVDAVLALWGRTRGTEAELMDNVRLAEAAMELGAALGAGHVVHFSSAAVYRPGPEPLAEEQADPQNAYGRSKLAMEQMVSAWRSLHGGPMASILRVGNVAGADSLFGNLAQQEAIELDRFTDGQGPQRSYVAPSDLAQVVEAVLASPIAKGVQILNVAAPQVTAMQAIVEASGKTLRWKDADASAAPLVALDVARQQALAALPDGAAEAGYLVAEARAGGVWP
ncbi:MAG: NAD-dependent epimerase/dehydratase family protein [Paracoccaceae bacterium]|nr:NAD-dependent epimerase/dehydratase family protein [Paracoccaceae bacterium]